MLKSPVQLKKADDLFEKSSMSFGEHLEELRKCLMWAFGWLGIGMAIGLPMANWVINYVQTPLKASLEDYYTKKSRREIEAKLGKPVPEDFFQWMKREKRYRQDVEIDQRDLLAAVGLENAEIPKPSPALKSPDADSANAKDSSKDSTELPDQATSTLTDEQNAKQTAGPIDEGEAAGNANASLSVKWLRTVAIYMPIQTNTEALGLQEPFMIWLKAGFVVGFVIASPGIFYSLWSFVAAGLYPHERRYVYFFLPMSVGLFLAGAALAFFFIFRFVIDFLLLFNDSMGINAAPRLTDYMSFALFLPLGFGIAFQLPLVMLILERIGITSIKMYVSQWRAAILIIAFVSMILTPAEVTSMIGMCVPLIGLYFFGIGLCHWLPRSGSPHQGYDPQ